MSSDPDRALVLGGESGLLGMALAQELASQGWKVETTPRPTDRHFDPQGLGSLVDAFGPDVVLNTWAYTQVDQAEDDPYEAKRVNAELPAMLADVASGRNFKLVHFSTDFVFDGSKGSAYTESDYPNPSSVYGKTKLSGEAALLQGDLSANLLIIRTAWLFGPGKKNFVSTICGLARDRDRLNVVSDQIGSPTYTPDLARYTAALLKSDAHGIFHVANAGTASWFDLAFKAVTTAGIECEIVPIPSSEYPQKARRPAYSVLATDKFTRVTETVPRPWKEAVQEYVRSAIRGD